MHRQFSMVRWLVPLQAGLVAGSSLGLLLLFTSVPAAVLAERIVALGPGESPVALSGASYQALRVGLGVVALVGLGVVAWARRPRQTRVGSSRRAPSRLGRNVSWAPMLRLGRAQKLTAGSLLVVGALLHGVLALYDPLSLDEAISYDWFMHAGPAVAASYYPFPNNHLLLNVVGAELHLLVPTAPPLLVLRLLPTVVSLGVLAGSYWLLLQGLSFGPATVAWALFNFSPGVATSAVGGRGYGLAFAALLGGLVASYLLLQPGGLRAPTRRRAWLLFGLSGISGLYAVPTHLYGLLGLLLSLASGFGRMGGRRRWLNVGHLAVVTVGMGLVVGVLYAPVVAVTSWPALFHNRYVQPLPSAVFWHQFTREYPVAVAGTLLGWFPVSSWLLGGVVVATPVLLYRAHLPASARRLGWLVYGQLVGWLALLLVQQVLPPPRTLLAVFFSFFALVSLFGQWAVSTWCPRGTWRKGPGLALVLLVVVALNGYRLRHYLVATAEPRRQSLSSFRRVYAWLHTQHPRRVVVESLPLAVYLRHEAFVTKQVELPVVLVGAILPGALQGPADYQVLLDAPADQPTVYRVGRVAVISSPPELPPARRRP